MSHALVVLSFVSSGSGFAAVCTTVCRGHVCLGQSVTSFFIFACHQLIPTIIKLCYMYTPYLGSPVTCWMHIIQVIKNKYRTGFEKRELNPTSGVQKSNSMGALGHLFIQNKELLSKICEQNQAQLFR